jgi:oxygen-dependent protoporphyrinogen oxidase
MASTWTSMKFTNRAPEGKLLLRCFVGGAHNEHLCLLNEEEIASLARNELREILGIAAKPLFTKVYRWEKSLPQYTIGHEEKIKQIETQVCLHPGLFLCGSSYWGIGISDCIRSGEKAVAGLIEFLKSQG